MTNKKASVAAEAKVEYAIKLYKKPKNIANGIVRDMVIALLLTIAFYALIAWYCLC